MYNGTPLKVLGDTTWHKIGRVVAKKKTKWSKVKAALKQLNINHNFTATTWTHRGGFVLSVLASCVEHKRISFNKLVKML